MKTKQQPYFIVLNSETVQQAMVDFGADHWLRLLSGEGWYQPSENGAGKDAKTHRAKNTHNSAEIIGKTGYSLYRSQS